MPLLVVSVFGHDRPGIIADVTSAVAATGGNLEDSTMTILRGRLAMMLVVSTPASVQAVTDGMAPLVADGMQIDVRVVPPEEEQAPPRTRPYVLSVHGGDRPGIVAAVTRVVADAGGNITDLTTRLSGSLYVFIAEVDLPTAADVAELERRLGATAADLGVDVTLSAGDSDLL